MRLMTTALLAFALAAPHLSAATVGEMVSQLGRGGKPAKSARFGAPVSHVGVEFVDHDFVIPVAGNQPGGFGTHWKSEVVISNYRSVRQRIAVSVLEYNRNSGADAPIYLELPPFEEEGELAIVTDDFMGYLGKSGLAAIVVQAVDAAGNVDENGIIDGYSRIWTLQPTDASCPTPQRGTVSQGMMTVTPDSIVGGEYDAFAVGLRQDDSYRTNVGIVNLSDKQVTWTVTVIGKGRAGTSFEMTVPAHSMLQRALPAGNYGVMSLVFTVKSVASATTGVIGSDHVSDGSLLWNAYASSVDNRSGDGWTRQASY